MGPDERSNVPTTFHIAKAKAKCQCEAILRGHIRPPKSGVLLMHLFASRNGLSHFCDRSPADRSVNATRFSGAVTNDRIFRWKQFLATSPDCY